LPLTQPGSVTASGSSARLGTDGLPSRGRRERARSRRSSRRLDAHSRQRDDPGMRWVVVVAVLIAVAAVAFVVVAYRRRWKWAGFAAEPEPGHKTVWDWLQLLIVPAILVGVTFAWSASQTRSDNKREDRRSQDAGASDLSRPDERLDAPRETADLQAGRSGQVGGAHRHPRHASPLGRRAKRPDRTFLERGHAADAV
jgi:hypothetical protein